MNNYEQLRLKAGLTQAQLAALAEVNQATIARIEKGANTRPATRTTILYILRKETEKKEAGLCVTRDDPLPQLTDEVNKATAPLYDKIRMQGEMIESQKQTIESQKGHIATLEKRCLEWERWSAKISKT